MVEMFATGEKCDLRLPYEILEAPAEELDPYPVCWGNMREVTSRLEVDPKSHFVLNYRPLVRSLVAEMEKGRSKPELAAAFHDSLIDSFLKIAKRAREITAINDVALSGGCWQNRILKERFCALLKDNGFNVMTNQHVPTNDGGIALGQALVAATVAKQQEGGSN
jgi:hydrogenase maturation factor HypF (carbamoyltransferase family)